ncbi:conserved hypothetical protein [[Clostridium] ultunense Esp]|nr:conserved hypothetical protein [[Clostridium] ultunense Esp]
MELTAILEKTDELIERILDSEFIAEYKETRSRLNQNMQAQEKIRKFIELKEKFEEVARFGKYHPDYKRIRLEALIAQRELELDPEISAFKEAERKLEHLFYEISRLLAEQVSPTILVPGDSPFATRSHCAGGGCSSSGCNIHTTL